MKGDAEIKPSSKLLQWRSFLAVYIRNVPMTLRCIPERTPDQVSRTNASLHDSGMASFRKDILPTNHS